MFRTSPNPILIRRDNLGSVTRVKMEGGTLSDDQRAESRSLRAVSLPI